MEENKRSCHKIQSTVRMRILNKNYQISYNQESPNLTKKESEGTEKKLSEQLCQPSKAILLPKTHM